MNIIISPFSRPLRNANKNPKNYPWWPELISCLYKQLPGKSYIIQVGMEGEEKFDVESHSYNRSLDDLKVLIEQVDFFISVDNFFHHLAATVNKPGFVIFGQSDPMIFCDPLHVALCKGPSFLRDKQFDVWEAASYREDVFMTPTDIVNRIVEVRGCQKDLNIELKGVEKRSFPI